MKPDATARLDRLIRLRRIKRGAIALLGFLIIAIVAGWLLMEDPVVSETVLNGTVTGWSRTQTDDGVGKLVLSVSLENGDRITILQRTPRSPTAGADIQVMKRQRESGRVVYRWIPTQPEADQ